MPRINGRDYEDPNDNWWNKFLNYYIRPSTDFLTMGLSEFGWKDWEEKNNTGTAQSLAEQGLDPSEIERYMSNKGGMTPEGEKWLTDALSNQRTQEAQAFANYQSEHDILNAAAQLQQLGLSNSGVLQTGGSAMNAVGAADTAKSNAAMERYSQRMGLAKQLLGMTSQMASAGVYGSALGAAKKASSVVASAASHSAYQALNYPESENMQPMSRAQLLDLLK